MPARVILSAFVSVLMQVGAPEQAVTGSYRLFRGSVNGPDRALAEAKRIAEEPGSDTTELRRAHIVLRDIVRAKWAFWDAGKKFPQGLYSQDRKDVWNALDTELKGKTKEGMLEEIASMDMEQVRTAIYDAHEKYSIERGKFPDAPLPQRILERDSRKPVPAPVVATPTPTTPHPTTPGPVAQKQVNSPPDAPEKVQHRWLAGGAVLAIALCAWLIRRRR